jgi:succinate-semialdehyde dehydrogenase / glutarate-semialdehyde dehydrogenase
VRSLAGVRAREQGGEVTGDLATLTGIEVPTGLLIGGKWSAGRAGMLTVLNPATEAPIAEVASASAQDALDAVTAAYEALPLWAARPPRERGECLRRAYELMIRDAEALARLMVLENGKALRDARGEIAYAAEFFRWYAEEAVRNEGSVSVAPSGANRILVQHQPVGVSVLITPWNFPAAMATRKIGPALAAGCTVILKPAKETPLSALAVAALLQEAGVPEGVVNVLPTTSPGPLTEAMLADPRVRKLSFTGSTEVGRMLLRTAADTVTNCSMELGGNAPFLVFEDADVDAAIEGAFLAKMRNGGEACTAANRFYVHDAVASEFSAKLAARLGALLVGPGLEEGVDLGPLVNADTRAKVASLVESATDDGSTIVTGGRAPDRPGYFYEPTVLDDVPSDAGILSEEIFGPVAPIVRFTQTSEAIALANGTEFGLVSYLYTSDLRRALQVAEALEAGMVGINRGVVSDPAAPFGGVKQSGLGREGGHDGLLEFTETKYIAVDW